MSLDRLMLEMENKFPDYFKLEKAGDKVTRQIDVSHPYVPLQRANLAREVHSRVRLSSCDPTEVNILKLMLDPTAR